METIADRIRILRQQIQNIASKASRDPQEIDFILVSKTVADDKIREAFCAGVRSFGENKIQEYLDKKKRLPSDIGWHFIGRLQTNKVKYLFQDAQAAGGVLPFLQSLDREELAVEIERQANKTGQGPLNCLIQVNCSGESTKGGFCLDEVVPFAESLEHNKALRVKGLMTIGPLTDDKEVIRAAFRSVKMLQGNLKKCLPAYDWGILSMGMSSDYEIALEEGATLLRIGSAVFGPRQKK